MELIYTTPLVGTDIANIKDIGVLRFFDADFAFGKSENNFEIKMYLKDACLEHGSLVYAENTEIGGIVDAIKIDSAREEITYTGRTWQGILASKYVKPPQGADYYDVPNTFFGALSGLIYDCGLLPICRISASASAITQPIKARYDNLYDVIKKLLEDNDLKLKITMGRDHRLNIYFENIIDYSQDEFLKEKTNYIAKKNYRPVNHIICLGGGQMQDRHVIDLYFDEAGNIQPYKFSMEGIAHDSTYIFDNRNQVLFGADEVTAVYEYSAAETKYNFFATNVTTYTQQQWAQFFNSFYYLNGNNTYTRYERANEDYYQVLTQQPSNWAGEYFKYYRKNGNEYVAAELNVQSNFTILTQRPSDWSTKYSEYFVDFLNNVSGVEEEYYEEVNNPAKDFSKKYNNYYIGYNDGTQMIYTKVQSRTITYYEKQSQRPDDWSTNWSHYYRRKKSGGYEPVPGTTAPNWGKRDYFTQKTKSAAALYDSTKTYYIYAKRIIAPPFVANTYYKKEDVTTPPTFQSGVFYQHIINNAIPPKPSIAYMELADHYEDLIQHALKKFEEELRGNEMEMVLNEEIEYDVGDIVGVEDYITGLVVTQKIVKKIIKIKSGQTSITYEEGESLW